MTSTPVTSHSVSADLVDDDIPPGLQQFESYKSYRSSKYLSIKHSSYFQVYDELFAPYRRRAIVFVEIGVLNGGSLFMWRDFFGPEARIIGIDLNPGAKQWEKDGFEIHIGSQSDAAFWDRFFAAVGDVDILLDDGGHTNGQQIMTAEKCIPHIKDRGMLLIEDTHSSYLRVFGNPSKYSFINYAKKFIDAVNSRFPDVHASQNTLNQAVFCVTAYESFVCFRVDRSKCFVSAPTSNGGLSVDAEDFRHAASALYQLSHYLSRTFDRWKQISFMRFLWRWSFELLFLLKSRIASRSLKRYFR